MRFYFKIGLKLYSTNTELIPNALLLKNKYFNYIELYIIPGSYEKTIKLWETVDVPFVMHAPHSYHGVNLADKGCRNTNIKHFQEVKKFADTFHSDIIIVHGGNNGNINETIEELRIINDTRIVIENKPKIGTLDEVCVGWSPAEFGRFKDSNVLNGSALDFTHAVCAARASNLDEFDFIKALMAFKAKIFHVSDIDSLSYKDKHLNFGRGGLDLKKILSFVPEGGLVTIETPRKNVENLSEFIADINYLQNLLS